MIFESDGIVFRFSGKIKNDGTGDQLVSYCHYGAFSIYVETLVEHFDPIDDDAKNFIAKHKKG